MSLPFPAYTPMQIKAAKNTKKSRIERGYATLKDFGRKLDALSKNGNDGVVVVLENVVVPVDGAMTTFVGGADAGAGAAAAAGPCALIAPTNWHHV